MGCASGPGKNPQRPIPNPENLRRSYKGVLNLGELGLPEVAELDDSIAASIYDTYSVGPSIRPICTRRCFTMSNMIQMCSIWMLDLEELALPEGAELVAHPVQYHPTVPYGL